MTDRPYSARFVRFMFHIVTPAIYFAIVLIAWGVVS